MKDIEVKKREWVKTAAIVFLSVMLVLTFFSNTILNRSLPEVAAEYTRASTITARIRGSGTVAANELFEVITKQAYTVSQVHARLGDEVKTGDVLITLSKESSEELETAQEELHVAELDLERYLITDSPHNNYASENRAIRDAQNSLNLAKEERDKAQNELNEAQWELDSIGFNEAKFLNHESDIAEAGARVGRREADESEAIDRLKAFDTKYGYEVDINGDIIWDPTVVSPGEEDARKKERDSLVKNRDEATQNRIDAQRSLDRLKNDRSYAEMLVDKPRWEAAKSKVAAADDRLTSAKNSIISLQGALDAANEALAEKKRGDGISSRLFDLEVREKERAIEILRKKVAELESGSLSTEITAAVSGKVTQVNISAGKETIPDEPLITIEVVDMGYTVSIPVTSNQSSRVRVGDSAEVDRGWWSYGEPISAVLTSIRSDPENPQGGRLLVFSVSGEGVEGGTQLNITIAQQSENYGIVVPNSAVRSDTNGDFVLVVETRSSPLRNRYIAVRVDVTILASDDNNTAINAAGLTGWDFVITTSTRPIEPGMQVRLVDNP